MVKKNNLVHIAGKRRKRPGRHSKKHKGPKQIERGQGHP
jgi:hypothetical protein